jgi:hypothetical protein
MRARFFLFVLTAAFVLSAPSALAQRRGRGVPAGPSDAERAAAREQFDRGSEAASMSRWSEAVDAFSQSHDLNPAPATLLNLATALAEAGRLREAADSYRTYLAHRPAAEIARYRRDAEARLADIDARIPRLTVQLHGLFPNDAVELDGVPLPESELAVAQLVDPGDHTLVVRRGELEALRRRVTLAEGARESLDLDVPAVVTPPPATPPPPLDYAETSDDGDAQPITKSPWFWVGIGAGVAAVAATVVVVVLVTSDSGGGETQMGYSGNGSPGLIEF